MRHVLLALLAALPVAAAAQLRSIPKDAVLGTFRHVEAMMVEVDGKAQPLAPGAQIRDSDNRLVAPSTLREKTEAAYQRDGAGMVHRVWLLSPWEKAALPPPSSPYPR